MADLTLYIPLEVIERLRPYEELHCDRCWKRLGAVWAWAHEVCSVCEPVRICLTCSAAHLEELRLELDR